MMCVASRCVMSVGVFEVVKMEVNYFSEDEDEKYCEEMVQSVTISWTMKVIL